MKVKVKMYMSDHLIDIFDENYNFIGSEMKSIAHQKALWHEVFTCLIINSKTNKIYFQKKVPQRYAFYRPDYIDITVGGHLYSGESVENGIREIVEETGFLVKYNDLISLGMRQNTFSKDKYFAFEYQHIYLCDMNCNLQDFKMNGEEVSGFIETDIDELLELLFYKKTKIDSRFIYMSNNKIYEEKYVLTCNDIIPSYLKGDEFLLRLVIAAKRFCSGEREEYLFW